MRRRGPQERDFYAGVAILLHPLFHFVRSAAGGHPFDIGIRNRFDQPFHAALGMRLLEKRDIFFSNIGLADAHLRPGNK